MKHYLLSVITPTDGVPPSPEELEQIMRRVGAFHQELLDSGAQVFDGGLAAPDTATVVRARDGGGTVLDDRPWTEGPQYVGGISIVRATDREEALDWGRRAALAIGLPVEVRAFEGDAEG